MNSGRRRRPDLVLLKDLAPVKDVKGGAGKRRRVFGERVEEQNQQGRQLHKKAKSQDKPKG